MLLKLILVRDGIIKKNIIPIAKSEPNQCFLVVAKSTEQAWIDCLVSFHGEKERSWLEMLVAINGPWYYYEIYTD